MLLSAFPTVKGCMVAVFGSISDAIINLSFLAVVLIIFSLIGQAIFGNILDFRCLHGDIEAISIEYQFIWGTPKFYPLMNLDDCGERG